MTDPFYDLAVIGGGVNGCGIARDAAGRGLKVYLCEQGDFASATSSASTKLIHGGLRYLEYFEFRLVREALREREVLWNMAPHIIRPLRFVLPHNAALRPAWVVRLALLLYDHLGGRKALPPTRAIDLRADAVGTPLRTAFTRGFEYSDCWVEDARLVVLNARDAADHGATLRTRTRCADARRQNGHWLLTVEHFPSNAREQIAARALVNAAGPWAGSVLSDVIGLDAPASVRLVKGSHIVVAKLYDHDRCYILQNSDGRIVFTIPFEGDFTLIGTTDVDYHGDPAAAQISSAEIDYLFDVVQSYFRISIDRGSVIWSYSGVRPLYDESISDAKSTSRDYVLALDQTNGEAPLLSVFGGKITTYRRLAEAALAKLAPFLAVRSNWTSAAALPGGDFDKGEVTKLVDETRQRFPFLDLARADRLVRSYGTRTPSVLGDARSELDLGRHFGAGLTEAEVIYLMDQEWAQTAEDVLWRRTKLGLRISPADSSALDEFMLARRAR